jgi:hypothetical protein
MQVAQRVEIRGDAGQVGAVPLSKQVMDDGRQDAVLGLHRQSGAVLHADSISLSKVPELV